MKRKKQDRKKKLDLSRIVVKKLDKQSLDQAAGGLPSAWACTGENAFH